MLVLDVRLRALHLAEHVRDQRAPVDLADLVRPDALSVAQHRHAVAQLEDLVEPVRDEDDAAALGDEVARRPEHALDLGLAQRRRRLVEDQQARVADEQAGDLHELPLADRERLDRSAELHVAEAELVEHAPRLLGETAPAVEQRDVDPSEEDVVLDAELGDEAQLLVHERDPVRLRLVRVAERELLAVEADHALVGLDEADERLHERALAGAVVPADRVHLAGADVEREAPNRTHRAVGLGEVDDLQQHRTVVRGGTGSGRQRRRIPFSAHRDERYPLEGADLRELGHVGLGDALLLDVLRLSGSESCR